MNYTAEQVVEAADKLRTVIEMPGITHYEIELYNNFPNSSAHELIGLGMVALAEHGPMALWRTLAYDGNLLWEVEDFGEYPTPLEAVVAACVAVLPKKDKQQ